ncbi:hypothetical protein ACHAXT_003637 [Thalassiosira profunda]
MPAVPFYSAAVREALAEIRSNHAEGDEASSASVAGVRQGTAIRGKFGGGYASSSDDGGNQGASDDEGSQSSASSASSIEAIDENDEAAAPVPTTPAIATEADAAANIAQGNKGERHKKSKSKRSKEDIAQKMGRVPSTLLPLQPATAATTAATSGRQALVVPNVLLPLNYLRDNPNYNPSSAAAHLLPSWDKLQSTSNSTIIVVLLQSGRFAAATFALDTRHNQTAMKMTAHKTSTRYTVRKGQGGSQSSHDQGKHKAKSVGAQLRREGEKQLREDVTATWKEWRGLGYIKNAAYVFASCPKGMRREYLFGGEDGSGSALVEKGDERLRSIPLDVGRPTMEAAAAVLDCVLGCSVREMTVEELNTLEGGSEKEPKAEESSEKEVAATNEETSKEEEEESAPPPPYTPLHEAVIDGDLDRLTELLKILDETEEKDAAKASNNNGEVPVEYDVNTTGGPDHQTALHIASSSTHTNASSLLTALVVQGHANPCAVDARGRPPYFLASSDKHREAFRLARGTLGEDYCAWDDGAKVGPALTEADVQAKKAKALEKKRRQRARQKEKKANEKAAAEKEAAQKREEEERKKQEADAKRVRDGLKPKTSSATNACDFCQKVVKGKRRSQMFQRLEYAYCSTECVRRHQRELMAAAATARMG